MLRLLKFPVYAAFAALCFLDLVSNAQETEDGLVAVFPRHFPPIYTLTQNGLPTGFGVEFMELVAEHAGLKIRYRDMNDWPDANEAIQSGEADLIPNMGITPGRESFYEFTKPYDRISLSIFVRKKLRGIHSVEDLSGRQVGAVYSNYAIQILNNHPGIVQSLYPSLGDLLAGLLDGEVTAVIYPDTVFEAFTAKLGVADKIRKIGPPVATLERAIAVRKGETELVSVLDRAIGEALASPEYQPIYDRWHPRLPPFWNTNRVATLVVALLVLFMVSISIYRFRVAKHMNKRLASSATYANAILDATSDGIVTLDSQGTIVSVNSFAESIFNRGADELRGKSITSLVPISEARRVLKYIAITKSQPPNITKTESAYSTECTAIRGANELFPARLGIAAMSNDDQYNFVCTFHDESRAQQAERRVAHLVNHDPLTGLLNLYGASDHLTTIVGKHETNIHCLCLGLTHLTQINAVYGREVGDQILLHTAVTLSQLCNRDIHNFQYVARSAGNRFIMVFIDESPDFEFIAGKIKDAMTNIEIPQDQETKHMDIDFALGIASYPKHASTAAELMEHAEIAYVIAKQNANNIGTFDPDTKMQQSEFEKTFQRIKTALNNDRVALFFQPIQNVKTGDVSHYEALLRMIDEEGALIMPADIIPIAERFHLISQIDYKVLGLVLRQLSSLKSHYPEIRISMNISAVHLDDSKLYETIVEDMNKHDGNYANLIFEITETAALQNYTLAKQFMNRLKEVGCRFALDDFGVGFTSFAQLRTLPVDIVKIDGMFIKELDRNVEDQVLVKAITDVAHSLGKEVIAEFVENDKILEHLREYEVDYAQGYHIGQPEPGLRLTWN